MCYFMFKKGFIVLLFILFLSSFVFAYEITDINIIKSYTNDETIPYNVEISTTGADPTEISISLNSNKQPSAIDFNATRVSEGNYEASFYIDFTSETSGLQNGWPKIIVNEYDGVVVSGGIESDELVVDKIKPTIGTFTLDAQGNNVGNFYQGNVHALPSGYSDEHTYIEKFVAYIVPILDIDDFKTKYIKKVDDTNISPIDLNISTNVNDGNYFVVVDAKDIAGNYGVESDVKNKKEILYLDNTAPEITSFNLNNQLEHEETYYVGSSNFLIGIGIEDNGVGLNETEPHTQITVRDPNDMLYNQYRDYNSTFGGFYVPIDQEFNSGTYTINLKALDLLENILDVNFNITIDSVSPDKNTFTISEIEIDNDRDVTITWTDAEDDLSGISHYEIYRSTSSFSEITTQTKLGETTDTEYTDTSSKSINTRYYYGVVAVDNAGNKSEPNVENIHTGPNISITIEDGDRYTNKTHPTLELEYSSDVNALRFSCNGTNWSSQVEVSGTTHTYNNFNMTSGNGCDSEEEQKTIYVLAISETNYPDRTSVATDTITYDKTAPTRPTNVEVTETEGKVRLDWTKSSSENSPIDEYRIYYSIDVDNVSSSSEYFVTSNNYYVYSPNKDQRVFFKISAIDRAGNESTLTDTVSGDTQRYGPEFTLSISPSNKIDDVFYVGGHQLSINITSDEVLKNKPSVSLKINSGTYQTMSVTGSGDSFSTKHTFAEDCNAEIRIIGTNQQSETAQDYFELKVKVAKPSFDINYTVSEEGLFSFEIDNVSEDVYRVQYVLLTEGQICVKEIDYFKEITENVFDCDFDSLTVDDGVYELDIIAYDVYNNNKTKTIEIEIDNIDEDKQTSQELKEKLSSEIQKLDGWLKMLQQFIDDFDQTHLENLDTAKSKILDASFKYEEQDFVSSRELYTQANILVNEIKEQIPEKKEVRSTTHEKTFNKDHVDLITKFTINPEVVEETTKLYESKNISFQRVFEIIEVNQRKFFIVSLTLKNTSSEEEIITLVENIPSSFTNHARNLVFNREVEILSANPLIKDVMILPPNSEITLTYSLKEPVTEVDVITKYNLVENDFIDPIVLSGHVLKDDIVYDVPVNTQLLLFIFLIMVIVIVILIAVGMISHSKKMKKETLLKPSSKEVMSNYFSSSGKKEDSKEKEAKQKDEKSDKNTSENPEKKENEEKKKFDDDYSYIMSAMKKKD